MSTLGDLFRYQAQNLWNDVLLDAPKSVVPIVGRNDQGKVVAVSDAVRFPSNIINNVDFSQDDGTVVPTGNTVVTLNNVFTGSMNPAGLGVELYGPQPGYNQILPDQIEGWTRRQVDASVTSPHPLEIASDLAVAESDWFLYRMTDLATDVSPLDPDFELDEDIAQYRANRSRPLAVRTYNPTAVSVDDITAGQGDEFTVTLTIEDWTPDVDITDAVLMVQPMHDDEPIAAYSEATSESPYLSSQVPYTWQLDISEWSTPSIGFMNGIRCYWRYLTAPRLANVSDFSVTVGAQYTAEVVPSIEVRTRPLLSSMELQTNRLFLTGVFAGDVVPEGGTPLDEVEAGGNVLLPYEDGSGGVE